MRIKNVRKPNEEEKKLTPILITFGISVIVVTAIIYVVDFNSINIGENLYINSNISNREIANHNFIAQLFELIYHRNYMTSKLEGITVSALISMVANLAIGGVFFIKEHIKEH